MNEATRESIEIRRAGQPDKCGEGLNYNTKPAVEQLAKMSDQNLDASSPASARSACSIMRNRGDIFDSADPESGSSQHPYRRLCAWPRRSRPVAAGGSHSNVEGGNSSILRRPRSGTRRLHRRIRRTLKPVCLHVLPAGTSGDGLSPSKVSDVHQCVVERGVYVRDTPTLNTFVRNGYFLHCSGEV